MSRPPNTGRPEFGTIAGSSSGVDICCEVYVVIWVVQVGWADVDMACTPAEWMVRGLWFGRAPVAPVVQMTTFETFGHLGHDFASR